MLSIGGAKAGVYAFDLIVNNPESQWVFIENTIDYLRRWKFDGLDIDWEYPGLVEKGTTEDTRFLFTALLKVGVTLPPKADAFVCLWLVYTN